MYPRAPHSPMPFVWSFVQRGWRAASRAQRATQTSATAFPPAIQTATSCRTRGCRSGILPLCRIETQSHNKYMGKPVTTTLSINLLPVNVKSIQKRRPVREKTSGLFAIIDGINQAQRSHRLPHGPSRSIQHDRPADRRQGRRAMCGTGGRKNGLRTGRTQRKTKKLVTKKCVVQSTHLNALRLHHGKKD